jgi:cysteine desulfurase
MENARRQVAELINADRKEIIFTSGATESNNLAIKGAAYMYEKAPAGSKGRGHIITAQHEHKATLDPCKRLMKEGFDVTFLEPRADGLITKEMVEGAMRDDTILVTIMWANNEIGTINEIPEIGALCHDRGVIFHTDATQWVGKMPTDVSKDNIDLLSFSGHKIYGPKGVGASMSAAAAPASASSPSRKAAARSAACAPARSTSPASSGLGKACELCQQEMDAEGERLFKLRTEARNRPLRGRRRVQINGHADKRLPHITNISFGFVEGESLMMASARTSR